MGLEADAAAYAARQLATIARRVGASLALDETLDAVANAVVEALGFRAAVVNLSAPDGDVHVVAVAGSHEVQEALMGTSSPRPAWDAMLAASTPWGALRFLSHNAKLPTGADGMQFYVPQLDEPEDEEEGRWHPRDALFAPLLDADGRLLGILSVDDPIDGMLPSTVRCALLEAFAVHAALAIEHARAHEALQDREVLLSRMFDESPVGKALFGPDGRYVRVNRAYCEFMGRSPEEFVGRRAVDFAHPEEIDKTVTLSTEIREQTGRVARVEKRYRHADGHELWGRLSLTKFNDADGTRVLAAIEDVTDTRAAEAQLRHHALHDSLTGLPNRTLIFDRLEQALARSRRDGGEVAVVVIDVDHFKLVNDSYGHPAGDQLLVAVTRSLQAVLRDCDTAGRLGGDEFIVVCERVAGPAEAATIAERLRIAARAPVRIGDVTFMSSASLGCTISNLESTPDELVAEADAALYRAKAAGRGRYEMFDEEMRRSSLAQLEMHAQLARALDNDELRLHYQPIIDLDTGDVLGYEALIRWEHPERGLLPPAEFLPVITDSELDVPVTQWVLRRACRDIVELSARTGEQPFISVNLSPRQLSRPDLPAEVESALAAAGLPADRLWLEITEEHLVDARHRPVLDRLQGFGCKITLDDFGTGYSGLIYLQQLPVNVLKLDRTYVAKVATDRISAGIAAAIADLADVLGIRVVAEGVETAVQAEILAAMGIRTAQGFLFGRPAPIAEHGATRVPVPAQREAGPIEAVQPPFATVNDSITTG